MSLPIPVERAATEGRPRDPRDACAQCVASAPAAARAQSAGTRDVARIAVLTAVAVLVRRFLTPQLPGLNLGGFPLILSGLVLGPAGGAWVGALSDLIGAYVAPHGELDPVYTVTAMLTAAVPPLVLRALGEPRVPRPAPLLLAIITGQLLTKSVIIPFYHQMLTGVPWWAEATKGLLVQLVHAPLYTVLAMQMLRALPARLATAPKR